jgi:polyribonucleotide nucleotidyltransferase
MDFKVAGTKNGITAIQMDTKLKGVPVEFLKEGLDQAKKARLEILKTMLSTIPESRKELSKYAPRISNITIDTEKIKDVIGPGGKVINQIIDETGVEIDIEDDGTVMVFSPDQEANKKAIEKIENIVKDAVPGDVYDGVVTRVLNFGAMVEVLPGKEGLVHISKISKDFVKDINKVVKVGDKMKVVVTEIDNEGRINLARKDL